MKASLLFHSQLLPLLAIVAGCASSPFVLTDESAFSLVEVTQRFASLRQNNPSPLIFRIEGAGPDFRDVYVGENRPDHTSRVAAFRVTADGRVWERNLVDDQLTPVN